MYIRNGYELRKEKGFRTNTTTKTATDPTEINKLKPTQIGTKDQPKQQLFNQQDQQPLDQQEYQHNRQNNTYLLITNKLTDC